MLIVATRGLLKDNINFVLTKKYKLATPAAEAAAEQMHMTIDTEDNTFIVSEVHQSQGFIMVYSNNIHWTAVNGIEPPPPHPEYGSPILPSLHAFCTLVDE